MTHAVPLPRYHEITACTESYFDRLGDSPLGMGWPNERDALTRYQVMLDVIREPADQRTTLLDFGCGTGHLYEYILAQRLTHIDYRGVDLSERFIAECQRKHPDAGFQQLDALTDPGLLPDFDYAVINGVFTSKCSMSHDEMFCFVQRVIRLLYSRSRRGIAFNAISKQVDWERNDLFHLPLDDMAWFLCHNLSRNFVVRNDYGLYEFTTYVYRDAHQNIGE
ncbi:MAG: class I SAM-dependent methyltransferase [Planctomycetaceae bacterium]